MGELLQTLPPKLLLLGAGYTGQRFLQAGFTRVDGARHGDGDGVGVGVGVGVGDGVGAAFSTITAWRSADWNLDARAPLPVPGEWTHLAYLVPPPATGATDPRLEHALTTLLESTTTLRRCVYLSTTGVYGDAGGASVNEDTPPNPTTPRAERRLAAEATLRKACAPAGIEWTVLRVPGIYGPGRLPLERLRRQDPLPESALTRPGNRIHVDDLVQAVQLALCHPAAANTVFNLGDGDHTGTAVYLQQLAELAGLRAPTVLPDAAARAQLSAEAWSFLMEARRVDTQRLRARLGFVPRYADCATGLRASLAETAADSAAD